MSELPKILAVGVVDEHSIAGTSGVAARWEELSAPSLGNGRTYRELFGKTDDTYRRLDRQTRAIVLAVEATGLDRLLTPEEREHTALVTETICGSIEADLKYTHSLEAGLVHAAIFPYTLQSTCLGDVALRHGLRGPTLCLSIDPAEKGEAMREAWRLFRSTGLRHAVVGRVDALKDPLPSAAAVLTAVAVVLAAPSEGVTAIAEWPVDSEDPFAELAMTCCGGEGR